MTEDKKKILFVCTGNTCRSPMAEVILRSELKKRKIHNVQVASAGVFVTESKINGNCLETLIEMDLRPYKSFKPRQITPKQIAESTVVICMSSPQAHLLSGLGNVVSMSQIIGQEVPDPYGMEMDAYRYTAKIFLGAVDEIIKRYVL